VGRGWLVGWLVRGDGTVSSEVYNIVRSFVGSGICYVLVTTPYYYHRRCSVTIVVVSFWLSG